jgi:hypothetical protein
MKCPHCKIHEIVIKMRLGDEPVVLHACSSCDRRDWEGLDGTLALDKVLDLAR